jgi:hypothetical protein
MFTRNDLMLPHLQLPVRARRAALAGTVVAGSICLTAVVPQAAAAASRAPTITFTKLRLVNGWFRTAGFVKPGVADISGIITLKGDVSNNRANPSPVLFTLPKGFRPATNVYVTSALCGAHKGRLFIKPSGVVKVQVEPGTAYSEVACVTSLDGISFAKSAASFTKLKLQNGWQNAPLGTSDAAARVISGIVHLKGAIKTRGTNTLAFTLQPSFRPTAVVFVPVDQCNGNKGRLYIQPDGIVHVYAENNFANAACETSLDGVTFAKSQKSFTALSLQNGWQYYGSGTYKPGVRMSSGIVRLKGGIWMGNPDLTLALFTLPKSMRPATFVYAEVDLFAGSQGRLQIAPTGVVTVWVENGTISNATDFISLDGVWFVR